MKHITKVTANQTRPDYYRFGKVSPGEEKRYGKQ
jgi:hypothetical protein